MSPTCVLVAWWLLGAPIVMVLDAWVSGKITVGSILLSLIVGGSWPVLLIVALLIKSPGLLQHKLWERK
jgi:hypothetical protein